MDTGVLDGATQQGCPSGDETNPELTAADFVPRHLTELLGTQEAEHSRFSKAGAAARPDPGRAEDSEGC